MWQKFVKAMLQNPKNQTGPSKEKNIVGFLKLKPFEDGYRVAGVGMDPEIRGQGKAIKLYLAFSAWKGIPIYSDYTQTPSAKTMWNSIIGRYPKRVVAYDQKNRQDIPLAKAGQIYQNQPDGFDSFTDRQAKDVLGNTKLLKLLPESIEAIQDTSALMKGIEADLKQREKDLKKLPKKSIYDENFADGKKKGKSRPGRVKKAGASCNGSVTSLRKKAKNSSGEKSKMYHWCANMKSGKKKK
jgi:hypothetical protein